MGDGVQIDSLLIPDGDEPLWLFKPVLEKGKSRLSNVVTLDEQESLTIT